jgi:hypothetical protein
MLPASEVRTLSPIHRSPTRRGTWAAALVVLAGVTLAPLAARAKDADGRKPIVDPRADQLLRSMSEYLGGEKQFTVHADVEFDDVLPTGQKVQYAAVQDIAVRRPNRAYIEYVGDIGANRLWYDGKRVTVLDGVENVYASVEAPGKLDATLDRLLQNHGFSPPLSDLLYAKPYDMLRPRIQFGLYLGLHDVDGVRCHHLAFVDKSIDWQIWIEDGPQIVPRKVVITYTDVSGAPQFEAKLSEWDFATRQADVLFTPMLPADAVQLEFLDVAGRVEKKK